MKKVTGIQRSAARMFGRRVKRIPVTGIFEPAKDVVVVVRGEEMDFDPEIELSRQEEIATRAIGDML